MHFAFIVKITEYERGWGPRPEGYWLFETEDSAKTFISEILSERNSNTVPDVYDSYDNVGYKPISEYLHAKLLESNHKRIWVKNYTV